MAWPAPLTRRLPEWGRVERDARTIVGAAVRLSGAVPSTSVLGRPYQTRLPSVVMDESPGIAKLYSVLIAGEYAAHSRLITELGMAPDVDSRIAMGRLAASEMNHFDELAAELVKRDIDPVAAVLRYVDVFDRYHGTRTNPKTWDEAMVKAYVGDGLAADFYRELAGCAAGRRARRRVDGDVGDRQLAVRAGLGASRVTADPALRWPLTLWGRRLWVRRSRTRNGCFAAEEDVTDLLFSSTTDLAAVSRFFDTVTELHAQRMADLGLGPVPGFRCPAKPPPRIAVRPSVWARLSHERGSQDRHRRQPRELSAGGR